MHSVCTGALLLVFVTILNHTSCYHGNHVSCQIIRKDVNLACCINGHIGFLTLYGGSETVIFHCSLSQSHLILVVIEL